MEQNPTVASQARQEAIEDIKRSIRANGVLDSLVDVCLSAAAELARAGGGTGEEGSFGLPRDGLLDLVAEGEFHAKMWGISTRRETRHWDIIRQH